jgi:hypothetical protein
VLSFKRFNLLCCIIMKGVPNNVVDSQVTFIQLSFAITVRPRSPQ